MFFLIALLAVFNLISAYASYSNDKFETVKNQADIEIIAEFETNK